MELLLNLLWLTLALPAFWVWRRDHLGIDHCSSSHRARTFVLLACVLMLLFPVISATDDLHAVQSEMEEANPLKRVVKQPVSSASASGMPNAGDFLAGSVSPPTKGSADEVFGLVSVLSIRVPAQARFRLIPARAPPFSRLG